MPTILSFIPDPIKQEIAEQLVDFLARQAEKFASEQIAGNIRKWSAKGEFTESVNQAIRKGAERFIGLRYLRVGGRGFCLGAGKTRSDENA